MFRISDFARLAQITPKALRLYDRLGLLKPAIVDPFTDYRYYTLDQLPRLNRILALKDLGFSLEQIRRLLADDLPAEQLRGMLRLKHSELEQQARQTLDRLTRVAARLKQIELEDIMPNYEVVLKKIQPLTEDPNCVACKGLKWIQGQGQPTVDVFTRRIEAPASLPANVTAGVKADAEPIFFIRSGEPPEDSDMLAAGPDDQMVTMPFIKAHTLPGVETAATVIHEGNRDTVILACRALVDWIEHNGYRVAGHYQEIALREDEPTLFELVIPVLKA